MRLALIALCACLAMPAAAQSIGEALPGRSARPEKAERAWNPSAAPRPCPEYGPGYVRVDGASTCVRLGGSVRVEYGATSRGKTGSAATGAVRLEARDETTLGPVHSVIEARGRFDRSPNGYAYGYR